MNPKKLWIITELFPPDETSTSYIMGEIANAMAKKYSVGVICGPEVYDKRKKIDVEHRFELHEGIEVHRAGGTGLDKNTAVGKAISFLLMSKRMMSLVRKYVREGDKVLMVTNPAPMVPLMAWLKRRIGFELNILVHDVFPENTRPAGLKLPLYGMFKIVVIENWADIINIRPKPFPEGKIVLEYAGNIGRVQGLEKVIDVLPDDIEFHLYGTGAMEERLKEKGHENVFFHGPYFRSRQNDVLAACDMAVVTLQEGMYGLAVPSKTYNILASGRPILFFGPEDSEIDLLVRENNIGYCGWPDEWNRNHLEEMGRRARVLAETKYSEKTILDKFLKII